MYVTHIYIYITFIKKQQMEIYIFTNKLLLFNVILMKYLNECVLQIFIMYI